jgi:hypothetical protein
MRRNLIKNIIKQVVCWILLLQIINISIDPPDLKHLRSGSITGEENLSVNKIESVYELIVEGVSDEEVPESEEDEIDTTSQSLVLYFFSKMFNQLPIADFSVKHVSFHQTNFPSVTMEPHIPPPKQA